MVLSKEIPKRDSIIWKVEAINKGCKEKIICPPELDLAKQGLELGEEYLHFKYVGVPS